jgi:hypothetical protein
VVLRPLKVLPKVANFCFILPCFATLPDTLTIPC